MPVEQLRMRCLFAEPHPEQLSFLDVLGVHLVSPCRAFERGLKQEACMDYQILQTLSNTHSHVLWLERRGAGSPKKWTVE